MPDHLSSIATDQRGATAIEYALIAGLVAIAIIAGLTLLGTELQAGYQAVAALV